MERTIVYNDGVMVKTHNKKSFLRVDKEEDSILLQFLHLDKEQDVNKQACSHTVIRGKVRATSLKLTIEGFELLLKAYIEYKIQNK